MGGKPQFAALPNRALWDRRLTPQDVRNLAAVAAHDRLSSSTGKGQGAWASHARMAALAGTEYSRFSVSINKMLGIGYLERERLATDRRKFTYRVLYTDEDSLPSSKQLPPEIVCSEANEDGEIVCSDPQISDCDERESSPQYISQSEGIDSAEAEEINSEESAHLAVRGLSKIDFAENAGGQMAALERAIEAGAPIGEGWEEYLSDVAENDDQEANRGRAERLIERVTDALVVQRSGRAKPDAACG